MEAELHYDEFGFRIDSEGWWQLEV